MLLWFLARYQGLFFYCSITNGEKISVSGWLGRIGQKLCNYVFFWVLILNWHRLDDSSLRITGCNYSLILRRRQLYRKVKGYCFFETITNWMSVCVRSVPTLRDIGLFVFFIVYHYILELKKLKIKIFWNSREYEFAKEIGFKEFQQANKNFEYRIIFDASLQKRQQELLENITKFEK